MSTTTTAPIARAAIVAAVETARAACENSPSWFLAVSKAAVELDVQRWSWDGSALVIASRTTPGKWYTVTAEACSCGHRCKWHKAARRIVEMASQMAAPTPAPAPRPFRPSFAQHTADVNAALFA